MRRIDDAEFYVFEATPPNAGALGTCLSDDVAFPPSKAWAREKRWATGAVVGVVGLLQDGCGAQFASVAGPAAAGPSDFFGGSCAPVGPFAVGETNPASWTFARDDGASFGGFHGNFAGTLRAASPGTGGLRIVYDGSALPTLDLEVVRPAVLQVSRHVFQLGKGLVDERAEGLAIAAGGSVVLLIRTLDEAQHRLCGRAPLVVSEASGLDLTGDAVHAGPALTTNGAVVARAGPGPGTARATLESAGASASLALDIVPLSALSGVDASVSASTTGDLLRLRALSDSREVAGALLRVEILTPNVVLTGEDGLPLPSPVETAAPALAIHAATATRVQLRLSAPGSSAPVRELAVVLPSR